MFDKAHTDMPPAPSGSRAIAVSAKLSAVEARDNAEEDEDLKDLPPKAADTAAPKAPAKK